MAWIQLPSISIQNGSKVVAINNGASLTSVKPGDALLIESHDIQEIEGVFANQLTLKNTWLNATQTGVKSVVIPTFGDFNSAVEALREATATCHGNFSAMETWLTEMGEVTFKSFDGTEHAVKTLQQAQADIASMSQGLTRAMSEVDFEARRADNKERYGVSRFVHFGKHYSADDVINEGLTSRTVDGILTNSLALGIASSGSGSSVTDHAVVSIAGVVFNLIELNESTNAVFGSTIKFPAAPNGTVTYDSATGAVVQHPDATTAFASETATSKVVTERVDMYGFESFLEEVSVTKPYVYPYGLIQSQATKMNGITTSPSNRPSSYYAVFDGDTSSVGLGVNFWAASETQQREILADPSNNLYYLSDGRLVQWRIRQRTIAGAGNGDWGSVESTDGTFIRFADSGGLLNNYIKPQGMMDTPHGDGVAYPVFASEESGVGESSGFSVGVYRATGSVNTFDAAAGINGECYFLVMGSVSRLNQGAYHPSFNPLGTARTINTSGDSSKFWYTSGIRKLLSRSDCFIFSSDTIYPYSDGKVYPESGSINRANGLISGRPDGRAYDAIYADGLGGVIDMRLGGKSLSLFGDDKVTLLAGEFRGIEYLPWTWVSSSNATSSNSSSNIYQISDTSKFSVGDTVTIVHSNVVVLEKVTITSIIINSAISWNSSDGTYDQVSGQTYYAIATTKNNLPVSGEFTMIDVIGQPANIRSNESLGLGWLGSWVPVIPDGTLKTFSFNRSSVAPSDTHWYTNDNGTTWTSPPGSYIDPITNDRTFAPASVQIAIYKYTAHATVTDPVNRLPVLGGTDSIKDVTAINWRGYGNNILFESMLGMINKNSDSSGEIYPTVKMIQTTLSDRNLTGHASNWGKLEASSFYGVQRHEPLNLKQPNNGNSALKMLMYPVVENGQLFIEIVYTQMIHNGSIWVDDNLMRVGDGDNLGTDLNNQVIKYGVHRTEAIGWI